jgi:hypothetical protein
VTNFLNAIAGADMSELITQPPPLPTSGLFRIGRPIDKARLTVRLYGDSLDPAMVTRRLCVSPTHCCRKGDRFYGDEGELAARTGIWTFIRKVETGSLDHHVLSLLQYLNGNPAVWRDLTSQHQAELNIVAYMWQWNQSIQLSADTILFLARRNITLSLDLQVPLMAPGSWG